MKLSGAAALVIVLATCTPALAQTPPTIAGDYVSTSRVYCQPFVSVGQGNGVVDSVTAAQKGLTSFSIALEYYDPRTTIVTAIGFSANGSAVLMNDSVNGLSGTPLTKVRDTQIFFYSNNLTTVTINGIAYHVTYGRLTNTAPELAGFIGVPEYFNLVAIDSDGCIRESEHVRRSSHALR